MACVVRDFLSQATSDCLLTQLTITKQQFVQEVLRELSERLCRFYAMLERGVAGFFVSASGITIKHGLTRPPTDRSVGYGLEGLGFARW
jgi:hypothetical protein